MNRINSICHLFVKIMFKLSNWHTSSGKVLHMAVWLGWLVRCTDTAPLNISRVMWDTLTHGHNGDQTTDLQVRRQPFHQLSYHMTGNPKKYKKSIKPFQKSINTVWKISISELVYISNLLGYIVLDCADICLYSNMREEIFIDSL